TGIRKPDCKYSGVTKSLIVYHHATTQTYRSVNKSGRLRMSENIVIHDAVAAAGRSITESVHTRPRERIPVNSYRIIFFAEKSRRIKNRRFILHQNGQTSRNAIVARVARRDTNDARDGR